MSHINAYAAGIFDGEGYVGIDRGSPSSGKEKRINYCLRVVISQKDGAIMYWLKNNFGGNVYSQRNGTKYSIYRWRIHSEGAARFLEAVLPYVIIKKPQVEFALSFNRQRKEKLILEGRAKSGTYKSLSKKEIEWRLAQKTQLIELKRIYVPYIKDTQERTK